MPLRADDVDALGRPVDPRLRGLYTHPMAPGRVDEVVLDPATGAVVERASFSRPGDCWATQLSAMDWSLDALAAPTVHQMLFSGYRPGRGERAGAGALRRAGRPGRPATRGRPGRGWSPSNGPGCARWPTGRSGPTTTRRRPSSSPGPGASAAATTGGCSSRSSTTTGSGSTRSTPAAIGAGPIAVLAAPGGATVPFLIHSAWAPGTATAAAPERARLRFADDAVRRPPGGVARRPGRRGAAGGPRSRRRARGAPPHLRGLATPPAPPTPIAAEG